MKSIVALVLPFTLCACSGLDDFRRGDPDVHPDVVLAAGNSSDPAFDQPLNAILEERVASGYTRIDDARTAQAIRAQAKRGSASAIPLIEQLVYDPVVEVQIQALAALGEMGAVDSLPVVAQIALTHSQPSTREQAYHVVAILTGKPVNFLDEAELVRVIEGR